MIEPDGVVLTQCLLNCLEELLHSSVQGSTALMTMHTIGKQKQIGVKGLCHICAGSLHAASF